MRVIKRRLLIVTLLFIAILSAGIAAAREVPSDEPELKSALFDIANNVIKAKNAYLVNGSIEVELDKGNFTTAFTEALNGDFEDISDLRGRARKADEYNNFHTELSIKSFDLVDSKAVLRATEYTVFNIAEAEIDPLAPDTTEYVQEHLLIFIYEDDGWKLSKDKLLNTPRPVAPSQAQKLIPVPEGNALINDLELGFVSPHTSQQESLLSGVLAPASLSRSAIVNYAYAYWSNYNSSYRKYSSDCTNFVSQAVKAGNWSFVSGLYTSSNAWWYNSLNQSRTWAGAHNWWWFTYNRPRGYLVKYFSDLQPGDILQVDFNKDGVIDHSMIVTKKDSSGKIYLTYHTTNTKDKSISSILQSYTNANYYGWRLYNSIY